MSAAENELQIGQHVRIDPNCDNFHYAAPPPHGGHIVELYPERREAGVRFYSMDEHGQWSWATWPFPIADLEVIEVTVTASSPRGPLWLIGEPLRNQEDRRVYEGGSFGVYAAPGQRVFIESWEDGRPRRLSIDPEEIDELATRLHQAKRYARSKPW